MSNFFSFNEALWDRAVRVILGLVLIGLGLTGTVSGLAGTIITIVGFMPLLTGLVGWCPAYSLFKFNTKDLGKK